MRAREAIGFLVAVLSVVVLTIQTVIAFLVGAEVEEVGGTVLIGLGALGWLIYTRRSLKKQGVPWWCSAEAAQFHKFKETGDPYEEPRIWECSRCGVHRQVMKESEDRNTMH